MGEHSDSNAAAARRKRLEAARDRLKSDQGLRPISRQQDRTRFPLSSSQQRLWFLEQVAPGSRVYHVPAVAHLGGPLDVELLEECVHKLVERHELLRSRVAQEGGEGVLIIDPETAFAVDRQVVTEADKSAALEQGIQVANDYIRVPFDLEKGPLFRVLIVELGGDETLLVFLLHHIICEAWSIAILFDELSRLYREGRGDAPALLPEMQVQFGDFARWEREALKDPRVQDGVSYWKEQLSDVVPVDLPTDRPRPLTQTQNGAILRHDIAAVDVAQVERFARANNTTSFVVALSALYALIYRLTGEEVIAVGSPVSSREREELQNLVGFFVNTLVLRGQVDETLSTAALVAKVRGTVLDAFSYQDAPFELIVDELNLPRDLSRNPLFQVMFALQNTPQPTLTLDGLTHSRVLRPEEVHSGTSKVDMSVIIEPVGDEWIVWAEYNSDLFDGPTVENFLNYYHALLMSMLAQPEQPIASLPFVPDATLKKILVDWNATEQRPDGRPAVQRVLDAASNVPQRVAVRSGDREITYAQLVDASAALGRLLRERGVGVGDVVAVFLPRSIEVVVAELAALRVGATYVPIDPNYPDDRVRFMIDDGAAKVAITSPSLADRVGPVEAIEIDAESLADGPSGALDAVDVKPDDLAYIIYTSGSTGRPKGVEVHHSALENFIDWQCGYHELTADDVYAMVVSPAFDASVWEIWPTLASGATICVADDETRIMADELVAWLTEQKVTITFLPTPLAEAVLAQPWPAEHSMRALLTGGEALHPVTRSDLPCRLFNHYGPTENTVITSVCEVFPGSREMPPIGRPIGNVEAYILDRRLRPVPPGAVGELCLAGRSVAKGYRNRPDLTERFFVANPIAESRYRRMYRTGDLCRFGADGLIHFMGRLDRQIKIRGYRVELGEIESVLLDQTPVKECAVDVHKDGHTGQAVLVAYVVPRADEEIRSSDLRKALNVRLPRFMIPQTFVELPALPRTKSGKIDRRNLPQPEGRSAGEPAAEPPETEMEQLVAQVWTEVLGVENISAADNFFDLGGNSLLAIQVVHKIRESSGRKINPLVLFSGSLRQTAAAIDGGDASGAPDPTSVHGPTGSFVARLKRLFVG